MLYCPLSVAKPITSCPFSLAFLASWFSFTSFSTLPSLSSLFSKRVATISLLRLWTRMPGRMICLMRVLKNINQQGFLKSCILATISKHTQTAFYDILRQTYFSWSPELRVSTLAGKQSSQGPFSISSSSLLWKLKMNEQKFTFKEEIGNSKTLDGKSRLLQHYHLLCFNCFILFLDTFASVTWNLIPIYQHGFIPSI